MTALTTIAIILALFLGMAIVITMRSYNDADTLRRQNKALNDKIERYKQYANDENATYYVRKTIDGRTAVCRTSYVGGGIHHTLIKLFSDEDEEFNQSEAEELCEMLNNRKSN